MTVSNQSHCLGCRMTLQTSTARRHLESCIAAAETPGGRNPKPMLMVSATAGQEDDKCVYALYALMPKLATLREIDELLRKTWLECCGHLSSFDSGGTRLRSDGFDMTMFDYEDRSFDHQAAWAIPPGTAAKYEYDMGDTTCLTVRMEPAPEQAQAWLDKHGMDPGNLVLRNLTPEAQESYRPLVNSPRQGIGCLDQRTLAKNEAAGLTAHANDNGG